MTTTPKVENTAENLRELLTGLYVAVIGHIPQGEAGVPLQVWDDLATTMLDAAEGRKFAPLPLPWPPRS
jgi:hypothetical protein